MTPFCELNLETLDRLSGSSLKANTTCLVLAVLRERGPFVGSSVSHVLPRYTQPFSLVIPLNGLRLTHRLIIVTGPLNAMLAAPSLLVAHYLLVIYSVRPVLTRHAYIT